MKKKDYSASGFSSNEVEILLGVNSRFIVVLQPSFIYEIKTKRRYKLAEWKLLMMPEQHTYQIKHYRWERGSTAERWLRWPHRNVVLDVDALQKKVK